MTALRAAYSFRMSNWGHCDGQMSDVTVVAWNWSSCYLRVVDSMAALCRRLAVYSGSLRRQMTVIEIIIAELHCLSNSGHRVGLFVRVTVAVNVVCAGEQFMCEMSFVHDIVLRLTRAVSATQRLHNIDSKCHATAPHTRNQRLIANINNPVCWCPALSVMWCDWWLFSVICVQRRGVLTETVTKNRENAQHVPAPEQIMNRNSLSINVCSTSESPPVRRSADRHRVWGPFMTRSTNLLIITIIIMVILSWFTTLIIHYFLILSLPV